MGCYRREAATHADDAYGDARRGVLSMNENKPMFTLHGLFHLGLVLLPVVHRRVKRRERNGRA